MSANFRCSQKGQKFFSYETWLKWGFKYTTLSVRCQGLFCRAAFLYSCAMIRQIRVRKGGCISCIKKSASQHQRRQGKVIMLGVLAYVWRSEGATDKGGHSLKAISRTMLQSPEELWQVGEATKGKNVTYYPGRWFRWPPRAAPSPMLPPEPKEGWERLAATKKRKWGCP